MLLVINVPQAGLYSQSRFYRTSQTEVNQLCWKCDCTLNISLSTLVLACFWQPLAWFILQQSHCSWWSLSLKGAAPLCSGWFGFYSDSNTETKSSDSLYRPPWLLRATQSPTVPDPHEAHVTSLFQLREMEFDSVCSCPESSGGCIKKASQQCWQEYIYRDCVSFQEAAGGGAGCHRSPWLAGRLFDLPITCTG